jgi:hypothetical protein
MLSAYASPTEVCRAALATIGGVPLTSITENSPQGRIARNRYEGVVNSALSLHGWKFAKKTKQLLYRDSTGAPLKHRYDLPNDMLLPRYVLVDDQRNQEYDIDGAFLHFNKQTTLKLVYTYRAPEGDWSADFAESVVLDMAAIYSRALLQDRAGARDLISLASDTRLRAMSTEYYSQRPKENDRPGPLVAAHKGYGRAQR